MAVAQRPEPGTAVAVVPEKHQVLQLLRSEEAQRRIIPLLGAGADYERVVAEMWLAIQANPKITECAPLEIVKSTARAVATGGTIGKDVYLVPFKGKLEVIEDYKFLAKLIVQAGGARAIAPGVVYDGDDFEFQFGTEQFLRHRPAGAPGKRKITHAYVIARVKFGEHVIVVLTREEIEAVRSKSRSWNNGTLEEVPWYGMKTAVRRVAKLLPSNPRLTAALARLGLTGDEDDDALPAVDELPAVSDSTITYALPPRGTPISHVEAYDVEPAERPVTAPTVDTSTIPRPDPAVIAHYVSQPDPYGLDPVSEGGEARSQSQAASASATPPSSAPDRALVDAARAFRNPFRNSASFGKPLGEFSLDGLQSLVEWIAKVRKETGDATKHAQVYDAAQLLIADAEAQQPQLALDTAPAAAAPASSTLAPGKVEDALAQARALDPQDERIAELTQQLKVLIEDPAFTPADVATVQRKLAAGVLVTVPALEAEIARLQRLAELPF